MSFRIGISTSVTMVGAFKLVESSQFRRPQCFEWLGKSISTTRSPVWFTALRLMCGPVVHMDERLRYKALPLHDTPARGSANHQTVGPDLRDDIAIRLWSLKEILRFVGNDAVRISLVFPQQPPVCLDG